MAHYELQLQRGLVLFYTKDDIPGTPDALAASLCKNVLGMTGVAFRTSGMDRVADRLDATPEWSTLSEDRRKRMVQAVMTQDGQVKPFSDAILRIHPGAMTCDALTKLSDTVLLRPLTEGQKAGIVLMTMLFPEKDHAMRVWDDIMPLNQGLRSIAIGQAVLAAFEEIKAKRLTADKCKPFKATWQERLM